MVRNTKYPALRSGRAGRFAGGVRQRLITSLATLFAFGLVVKAMAAAFDIRSTPWRAEK